MPNILRSCTAWLAILSSATAAAVGGQESEALYNFESSSLVDAKSINPRATTPAHNKTGICFYLGFQSIFMQDRVYVDGGLLYYMYNETEQGSKPGTDIEYPLTSYIDLNKKFDFSTQQAQEKVNFFTPVENIPGRTGLLFGGLLGNDYSWVQYGGMQDSGNPPSVKRSERTAERFDYEQDPNNPTGSWGGDQKFSNPVTFDSGSNGVTNYVYGGAVASSPGDKKSWWFSGTRGEDWGELIYLIDSPTNLSNYLITADFSDQQNPKFTKTTIDSKIAPRVGASMVFLPVGEKGILVVVGGVSVPDPIWMVPLRTREAAYDNDDLKKQAAASRKFLQTIDIYDIASGKWYSQPASGAIPSEPISAGCAVAASADDRSSHNIYFYGGHGGLSYDSKAPGSQTNSKFYVLTLPHFRWIQVLNPNESVTGRSLHQCHRVHPNQMLVVGGHPTGNHAKSAICAMWPGPGPAMVFNMNTCEVQMQGWDPEAKADYQVPEKVTGIIGGNGKGGASKKAPEDDEWANDDLKELFSNPKAYTERVTPLWAYTPTSTDDTPGSTGDVTSDSNEDDKGSTFPKYIPPLLGTLLGLFAVITILSIALFILRRRKQKRAADAAPSETEGSTVRKNKQTWSWLLGVYGGDEKSSRGTHQPLGHIRNYSDDGTTFMYGTSTDGNRESVMSPISPVTERSDPVMELQGKTIHEMPDTSIPLELSARTGTPAVNPSFKKDPKTVHYEDQEIQPTPAVTPPAVNSGNEIHIAPQAQGGSSQPNLNPNASLGHRKLSSLDYPE